MFHTLTLPEFQAVRRALAAGMRYAEIARELDLSVWTIGQIANERRFQCDEPAESDLPEDDAPPEYAARNLRRCPGCGAMVYLWPCPACRLGTTTKLAIPDDEVFEDDDDEGDWPEMFGDELTRS
jgi:hypothetical protein